MINLSTVASVKQYLGISSSGQDALISNLIPRESRLIEKWTGRTFQGTASYVNKRLNGGGSDKLMLPDTPILAVTSVAVGTSNYTQSPDGVQAGYMFDNACLYLIGGDIFWRGRQNVSVTFTAGYVTSETDSVPTGNTPTVTPVAGGRAVTDMGVVYAVSGANLVATQGNLSAGQYSFNSGVYTFSAADSGNSVTMTYAYVPSEVEQACNEMVGLDLKQRDNLGINSKSLAQETITYSDQGITKSVAAMLQDFRRMYPV